MYTVPQKKARLKGNKPKHKNSKKTKGVKEPEYLDHFAKQCHACFVCGTRNGVEGHHVKLYSTDAKDDRMMLPLCQAHHTGNELSPHGTPKLWRETYSIEEQKAHAKVLYTEFIIGGSWL